MNLNANPTGLLRISMSIMASAYVGGKFNGDVLLYVMQFLEMALTVKGNRKFQYFKSMQKENYKFEFVFSLDHGWGFREISLDQH